MRGDTKVVEILNHVLAAELTAINQYFIHAKICENWGYRYLAEYIRHESIDEMKHADIVIDRILFLEGIPNMQHLNPITVGETVPEQFQVDLQLEYAAVKRLNDGIATCAAVGDNTSRALLEGILVSEEEHADWLEAQLELIRQVGEHNYLAQQVRD
jgi:bacterioferritin